ncbi:SubName: Full=Uncharacterized protein {ECO:0000313/EMBL:CCA67928.1} [Serendipita indica DSM 11827]|uniref:Uncharacterized protein n=1 Tax=Serendipita indica (strain DSM 11827) TaxID=1109443 RepID=G4T9F2_SERID|nr:SubName: Full=Uncharacterized protein {ECO:0000313/EMBL:CCA67928.1} [Serendipita indica DSM 11827]CCA67928.1 hypothetical protein PIIN_01797 [Serendipita indica DSM 11827]
MVKRKYSDEEQEFDDSYAQPVHKRIAIRTQAPANQGQMDIEMGFDDVSAAQTPNDDSSSIFTAAYPPTSQSLYPFPTKKDDMDCDDGAYSPETSVSPLSKMASDPVHGQVVDNRYPSNASSIAASTLLQPRTRNASCTCPQIPRLVLAQYANEDGKKTMWSHCTNCGAMDMVLRCDGSPVLC